VGSKSDPGGGEKGGDQDGKQPQRHEEGGKKKVKFSIFYYTQYERKEGGQKVGDGGPGAKEKFGLRNGKK